MAHRMAKKAISGHQMIGKIAVGYHDGVHIDIQKYQKKLFCPDYPFKIKTDFRPILG